MSRQIAFRTGNVSAGGGRPIVQFNRHIHTVVAGQLLVSATTAGDTGAFNICNWSNAADLSQSTSFSSGGTGSNHPSEHEAVIALGYDRSRVLSALYRFDVRFKGTGTATKDFIFAYKFSTVNTTVFTMTAGTVTIDNFKDIRQSPGWVWQRFSAINSGGSIYPSQGRVEVRIPSIFQLGERLSSGIDVTATDEDNYSATISDGNNDPNKNIFLHIVCMTIDGVAWSAGDVAIDVTIYQKVKISRSQDQIEMVEEADQF